MVSRLGHWLIGLSVWDSLPVRVLAWALALLFFTFVIVTPLSLWQQTFFGIVVFAVAFALNRLSRSRFTVLLLMSISVAASLRYLYWRVTQTLGFESWIDMGFGYGLLLAELYALTTLLLSYVQSAWPLRRQPVLLPDDMSLWPSVDIFITTYNEPLSVVRQTVLTALSQDWPSDRLKIHVLDDGRREEFRRFCERVGVGYLTRPDNRHAKAGNINAALARTSGEYVVVFDCDHIPTRSFLQITMGWFLKDPKLAMLQTPHVYFSPDPMEHNLEVYHRVPNEGHLFYGLTQDGNDLWNATFFCGSCAVLRRSHLDKVGGVATESVTEDALTALKMNQAGFNTAYLSVPQAAGLATENLSRHIGQRIRWARGMAQIMRSHNPLLAKGLSLWQRICYLSASLHFFYGIPRLVFLTAPLAYLFFGAHVFQAEAVLIIAYVLPHILHAELANYQIQGRFRHSFWNEIYESVLAWYLARPTLATLVRPGTAVFNVTAKGGANTVGYFEWKLARPYIVLLLLNLAGMAAGVWLLFDSGGDSSLIYTAAFNMAWTFNNIVICSASVAVAGERRQIRSVPRVEADLRVSLALPSGHRLVGSLVDFSSEGLGLAMQAPIELAIGDPVSVSLFLGEEERVFPAIVQFSRGRRLGLALTELSLEQQIDWAQMTFGRADIWMNAWYETVPDAPVRSFLQVGRIGVRGIVLLARETARELGLRAGRLAGRQGRQHA